MSQLPDYVASAQPNSISNRAPWLTTTAATYAGIMLWFVFWQEVPMGGKGIAGGTLSQGLGFAIFALVVAAFLCHFLCYIVPGMLGMKTGLTLTVIGTSTYGVSGGYIMPGFLMGALQFGWLSVNAYFSGWLLASIGSGQSMEVTQGGALHLGIGVFWILIATFVGMKGVKYVGAVASFTPIIPIVILCLLLFKTMGGVGSFSVEKMMAAAPETFKPATLFGNGQLGVLSLMCAYVVGFFATAGAAGVDFGSNNKDGKSVQMGGFVGIILATILTGTIALLAVAGAQKSLETNELLGTYNVTQLFEIILGSGTTKICMFLLALAAFPSACFPAVIASNAFKTTFPKINPLVTCGIGVIAAIVLVITQAAGSAGDVFTVVGASFGPICGAMAADYLLAGRKWAGPRAGFNPAGWISWFFGFIVGATTLVVTVFMKQQMPFEIPCPPISAVVVGFVLYIICAKIGLQSKSLNMPQRIDH